MANELSGTFNFDKDAIKDKILKALQDGGKVDGGTIDVGVNINVDDKTFYKKIKNMQSYLEKMQGSSTLDFGGSKGFYDFIKNIKDEVNDLKDTFTSLSGSDQQILQPMMKNIDDSMSYFYSFNKAVDNLVKDLETAKQVIDGDVSIDSFDALKSNLENSMDIIEKFGGSVSELGLTDANGVISNIRQIATQVDDVSKQLQSTINNLKTEMNSGLDATGLVNYQKTLTSLQSQLRDLGLSDDATIMKDASSSLKVVTAEINKQSTAAADALKNKLGEAINDLNKKKINIKSLSSSLKELESGKATIEAFGKSLDDFGITNYDTVFNDVKTRVEDVNNVITELNKKSNEVTQYLNSGNVDSSTLQQYKTDIQNLRDQLTGLGSSSKAGKTALDDINNALRQLQNNNKIVIDMVDSNGQKITGQSFQDAAEAVEYVKKLLGDEKATVTSEYTIGELGDITGFTLNVTRATGEVEKLHYALMSLPDSDDMSLLFSYTKVNDAGAVKQLQEMSKYANKLETDLVKLKNSTAGVMEGTEAYKGVETTIQNLRDGTGTIDEATAAWNKLKNATNDTQLVLRNGKGLNNWQNAVVDINSMGTAIDDVKQRFAALNVQSEELKKRIDQLDSANKNVQDGFKNKTDGWAKSYIDLKNEVSSIFSEIDNLQKSAGATYDISSLSSSNLKYIQDFTGTVSEAEAKINEFGNAEGWKNIKVTGIETANGQVKQLAVSYTDATGAVKEFKMAQADIMSVDNSTASGLVQSSDVKVIKTAEQAYIEMWDAAIKENEAYDAAVAKSAQKQEETISKIVSSLSSYSSTSTKQQDSLSVFGDLNSKSLNEARQYANEYQSILNDLTSAYNKDTGVLDTDLLKTMGWDESQIQNVEQKLKSLSNSFSAAMSKVKQETQGVNFSQVFSQLDSKGFETQVASLEQQITKIGDRTKTAELNSYVDQLNQLITTMKNARASGDMSTLTNSYTEFVSILKKASNEAATFQKNMTTSGKISGYENQLSSLKDVYKETEEYQNAWRALYEYSSLGIGSIDDVKSAFDALNAKVKETQSSIESALKAVSKNLSTGFYSSTSDSQKSQLSLFGDFNSEKITELKGYANGYENIVQKLTESYDVESGAFIGLTDEEVAKDKQRLDTLQASFNNTMKSIKADLGSNNISKTLDISTWQSQVNKFQQQLESLGTKGITSSLSSLSSEIQTTMAGASEAWKTGDLDAYNSKIQELNSLLTKANQEMTAMGSTSFNSSGITSFISGLSSAWSSLSRIFGAGLITREIRSAAKEMVSTIQDIDTAMAQLEIATGATDSEMSEFLESSIQLSKELGQTVSDMLDSITTFSRLGYDLNESSQLANYAAILSNTAGVESDEATTGLTSIVKAYSMSVDEAEHVADVLIEVGNGYAVSASELMEAFEKAGAALNASNTSYEESTALIAAANSSIQNASSVGTALKTVSARIRGSSSELEELGEDTSDLSDSFSKYASEIKSLTGFSILEDGTTDTYKSIYDIFEGISKVWGNLSDTSQSRVAEILGGTRQLSVIASILENFSDASGAYADAMDSAGTATEANEIYMASLEAA